MKIFVSRFLYLFFVMVVALFCQPPASGAETGREYQVKAAFFYHFANFVDWPASTFKNTKGKLRICVIGKDPFGKSLETTLANKSVRSHSFEIRRNPPTQQLSDCHLLYLPASASSKLLALGHQMAKKDVLTVGETHKFMQQGGMVQFFVDDQKIRFAINTHVINQTNLQVSSKLLRLAKIYSP